MLFNSFFIRLLFIVFILLPDVTLEANIKHLKRKNGITLRNRIVGNKRPIESNNCVSLRSRDVGMFSVFFDVIALLKSYEEGVFTYVEVDFADTGLYYDQIYGPNWWEYYFKPITLGKQTQSPRSVYGHNRGVKPWDIEFNTSKEEVHQLIQKYISIQPAIQEEIDSFANLHFKDTFIIGIHYRGTDKKYEAPRVKYEKVTEEVLGVIDTLESDEYKIFVATDEQAFLDYAIALFQDKICWVEIAPRSTNGEPIHDSDEEDHYILGKTALMDCILLSKTNFLIRTSSNLSKVSTYFNLELPVIELNQRHRRK